MWLLFLNDMRFSKIEQVVAVCKAATKEELKAFIARETVAPYSDPVESPREDTAYACFPKHWGKSFRKGGPLEWYNPPSDNPDYERGHFRYMRDVEEVVKEQVEAATKQIASQIRQHYSDLVSDKPDVSTL